MNTFVQLEKPVQPELAKHDSSILDLAFVMDCTGSMGGYIESAKNNIRSIVKQIIASEKSDIRLALIEYRDHPPQDKTFVTRTHDFTSRVDEMKSWLDVCEANGGGDTPEAVADALAAILKLSWRQKSTKICVLIADAPPHGLNPDGDEFPTGCPDRHDPARIIRDIAQEHITLYTVGVEPPIVMYRDFFMALAYITGGQYVPMVNAQLLAKVIIGGVREELSLNRLMENAYPDIDREMCQAEIDGVDERIQVQRLNQYFTTRNIRSKRMKNNFGALSTAATDGYAKCPDMAEMRIQFQKQTEDKSNSFSIISYNELSSTDSYDLLEDELITEDQTARLVQKWKQQKKSRK